MTEPFFCSLLIGFFLTWEAAAIMEGSLKGSLKYQHKPRPNAQKDT